MRDFAFLQIKLLSIAIIGFFLIRLAYFFQNIQSFGSFELLDLALVLIASIRFDLCILGFMFLFAILISMLYPKRIREIFILTGGFLIIVSWALSFGDLLYSSFAGKRLTYELEIFFSSQAPSLIGTAFELFYIKLIFAILVVLWFLLYLYKLIKQPKKPLGIIGGTSLVLLNIVIFSILARGTFERLTLQLSHANVTDNYALNLIVPNTVFLIEKTIEGGQDYKQFMPNEKAYEICKKLIKQKDSHFYDPRYPFLRKIKHTKKTKPNIILILLESWSKKYLADKYKDITPNFHALKEKGLSFDNFYANGTRSSNGLYNIITGFADFPGKTAMVRPELSNNFISISDIFNANGYETAFINGGNLDFDNLNSLLKQEKFKHVFGQESMPKTDETLWWGVRDETMYDFAYKKIKSLQKPFFSMLFTVSTHGPYHIDKNAKKIYPKHKESGYINSLRYADKSLGNFLQDLNSSGLLDNTLIVLVADHTHHHGLSMRQNFSIPMLWYSKTIELGRKHIDTYASGFDILTSLANFSGLNYVNSTLGKDILQSDTNLTYVRSDDIMLITPDLTLINNLSSKTITYDKNKKIVPTPKELEDILFAYYQCSVFAVRDFIVAPKGFEANKSRLSPN